MQIIPRKVIKLRWPTYEARVSLWALHFYKNSLGLKADGLTPEILSKVFITDFSSLEISSILNELEDFKFFKDILSIAHSNHPSTNPDSLLISDAEKSLLTEEHAGFLYKYFKANRGGMMALKTPSLKFDYPSNWNDLFEANHHTVESGWRVCDQGDLVGSCFSTKWDNLLMWSHYADSYRGFCVGYQIYEGTFIDQDARHRCQTWPVSYFQKAPNFPLHADALIKTAKPIDWAYEDEYRLLLKDFISGLYPINFDSVREIVLGPRCDKEKLLRAARIVSNKSGICKIFETKKHPGRYALVREEVI